jgi:hypothetical protein
MLITLFFAFVVKERPVDKSSLLMAEHNTVKFGRIKSAGKHLFLKEILHVYNHTT